MIRIGTVAGCVLIALGASVALSETVSPGQTASRAQTAARQDGLRDAAASRPTGSAPSLAQAYAAYFPIGAAIWQGDLSGPHAALLASQFNSIVSENDMKWMATEPRDGEFTFGRADAEVAFAQAHHMRVRGHNLVWHQQIPAWVFRRADGAPLAAGNAADRGLLIQRMQRHIRTVMTHLGSAVYAWDVVNEPIDASQPDCLRRSPWREIIGPEYLDMAFRAAREANPRAELFLNEYDTTLGPKRACLLRVVKDLRSRGVPLDAVGHQMHTSVDAPSVQSFVDTVNQFAKVEPLDGKPLDQQVTELDMSVYSGPRAPSFASYDAIPQSLLARQAERYGEFFEAFKRLRGKLSGVTFWGYADDHTWLTHPARPAFAGRPAMPARIDAPLLFDRALEAKPVLSAIIKAASQQ